jgi:thiamine transport system permease protein
VSAVRGKSWRWVLLLLPAIYGVIFFAVPLVQVARVSGLQLDLLASARGPLGRALTFSLWQALLSTLLTLAVGLPAAYVLYRFRFPASRALRLLTAVPFILPTVVVAAAFNAYAGPHGWLNQAWQAITGSSKPLLTITGSLAGILLAHVFYNLTIIIRMVGPAWAGLNPRLDAAARTLGANPWQVFLRVTLPLLRPVIVSAAVLVFLFDFTSFGVILLVGGMRFSTLEVEIYRQTLSFYNLPLAGLLALIQLICTLACAGVYQYFSARPVPLAPANERRVVQKPRGWRQVLLVALTVVFLWVFFAGPLASLTASAFWSIGADRGERALVTAGWTLDNFSGLAQNRNSDLFYVPPLTALLNSLKFASLTAFFSLTLGMLLVYGLPWRGKWRSITEVLLMLPLGTSAVTLGLGYILAFNQPPLAWGSSAWMLPLAHTLVALPFVVRTLLPAVAAIPDTYRQSAAVLGANRWYTFWRVDLPLIRRVMVSALIFAFTISLGEFGATSLLYRPEFPTLPIAIFRYLSLPGAANYGQAMAMSLLLMLTCAVGILVIERTTGFLTGEGGA